MAAGAMMGVLQEKETRKLFDNLPLSENGQIPITREASLALMNESWVGRPVEEVDPLMLEDTFCVIQKKYKHHYIFRYSISKSLFIFGPLNCVRKFAIHITTHRWFDMLIIMTIISNCITLATISNIYDANDEKVTPEYYEVIEQIEYGFLTIYTIEMVLKIIAKGFLCNKFAYLRNRWNMLDCFVVVSSYVTLANDWLNLSGSSAERQDNPFNFLRTFRVLRAIKTFSMFPGLRLMINALLNSVVQLVHVLVLTLMCLMIFAIFALEMFGGKLRQKCVLDKGGPADSNFMNTPIHKEPKEDIDRVWTMWVSDWRNWHRRVFPVLEPTQCANLSDSRLCPEGYTCLPNIGDNPDFGWSNFDSFSYATLSTFQLITLDYWERLFDIVVSTTGLWAVMFFLIIIFLGSYYLLNLMLAVVAMSYETEAQLQDQGPQTCSQKLAVTRNKSNFSFDSLSKLNICKMTYTRVRSKSEKELLARRMRALETVNEEYSGENINFGDTVFGILGMRMSFGTATEELTRRIGSVSSLGFNPTWDEDEEQFRDAPPDEVGIAEASFEGTASPGESVIDSVGEERLVSVQSMAAINRKMFGFIHKYVRPSVTHWAFDAIITVCIIANTALLAMEHHGASETLEEILKVGNHIFMAIFTAECILKLLALQREYFQSNWNIFDMISVVISYVELVVSETESNSKGARGLSVVRSMRLLRVFKLAQTWVTMKVLLNIIFSSFGALWNLTLVLFIVLYIFAVMGMQIVGADYTRKAFDALTKPQNYPRWNFKHFWYAFNMVFRVLCGEWIEPLWDCLQAQQKSPAQNHWKYSKCFVIFLPILIVGNFIVLNLFLALLLNSFDTEELMAQRAKVLEAKGASENLQNIIGLLLKNKAEHVNVDEEEDDDFNYAQGEINVEDFDPNEHANELSNGEVKKSEPVVQPVTSAMAQPAPATLQAPGPATTTKSSSKQIYIPDRARKHFRKVIKKVMIHNRLDTAHRVLTRLDENHMKQTRLYSRSIFLKSPGIPNFASHESILHDETPEGSVNSDVSTIGGDCIPWCYRKYSQNGRRSSYLWQKLRKGAVAIVTYPLFEWTIMVLIFSSSITLCFEDIHLDSKPELKKTLCTINYVFTGVFVVEMILKWFAIGVWGYFTNFWTILDAFIVGVSLTSMYFEISLQTCSGGLINEKDAKRLNIIRVLKTLRALRPLRAVSRWQGMKIVVNALIYAIPSIFNVLLVCLLFWLIFAIMGVQFFKGQFYACVNKDGEMVDPRVAPNKDVCCAKAITNQFSWINSASNFDNVFEGYLSLFQVATFEGWMELMQYSVDATGVNKQPVTDNQTVYYAFYLIFIVLGSFFTLQLFIGVIIDNFNMLKKKYEGSVVEGLLTTSQRKYYIAMKNLGRWGPVRLFPPPKSNFRYCLYLIAMSRKLEVGIFITIFLNMIVLAFHQDGQLEWEADVSWALNTFFTVIYVLEAIVKIVGIGSLYFTVPWNVFDLVVICASTLDIVNAENANQVLPLPPTMLRMIRVFRIGRVLRLVRAASGIRKLMFALIVSLPALFNIAALLLLITFIYAISGMALFGKAPKYQSVDNVFNFETFPNSCMLLFRLMTAAGWNEVLESLTVVEPVCGTYRPIVCGMPGEPKCPHRGYVVAYIVSYVVLTYLIVINLYIAIILENYVEATNEENVGILEDDLEMFYARWARYDPYATQFIQFEDLSDFLDSLDKPLGVPKPNTVAIVAFNLPIARGDKLHCVDILYGLIKHTLGQVDDTPEFRKFQHQMELKFHKQFPTRRLLDIVSSTRQRRIESKAVIIIQRAWRKYLKRKYPPKYVERSTQTHHFRDIVNHGGLGHMMDRLGNVRKTETHLDVLERASRRTHAAKGYHAFVPEVFNRRKH